MALRRLKQFWRRIISRGRSADSSPASDLAHQLSVIREEKEGLQAELLSVREELVRLKSREEQHRAVLHQRIRDLASEGEATGSKIKALETSLLHLRSQEEERLAVMQQQIRDLESEGESAGRQIMVLETALQDATAQRASTEKRVENLETRLVKQHHEHLAARQDTLVREQRQNRRLNLAMGVAGLAFLLGTLAGAAMLWDARNQAVMLAELRSDIHDIKISLEQRPGNVSDTTEESRPTRYVGAKSGMETALAETDEGSEITQLNAGTDKRRGAVSPSYSFHPHTRHRSKQEMQAFFEENARQDGVVSLSSGLQYKVLNRGIGRPPETGDKVVIDYRVYLPDGEELYNTYNEPEPATLSIEQIGNPGLQEALQQMEEGAQWELYIPPALAYREGTRKRRKYGYEPLIYVVELKSVIKNNEVSTED